MPPCYRYLYSGISVNLILCYLVTTLALITNTSTILTTLISLSRYLFINSFASDLSDRSTEIAPFSEYNIFIVFTDLGTPFRRLIFIFNSNIKSSFGILSISPYFMNINRFDIFIFFCFFLFYNLSFLLDRDPLTFI